MCCKELYEIAHKAYDPNIYIMEETSDRTNIYALSHVKDITDINKYKHLLYLTFDNEFGTQYDDGFFGSKAKLHSLPKYLKSLTFGWEFDQLLEPGVLPDSIQYLKFGNWYKQPFTKDVLPKSLKYLIFNGHFNCEFDKDVLPNGLKHLTLSVEYNQPFAANALPNSLKTLKFNETSKYGHYFLKDALPNSLTELHVSHTFKYNSFQLDNMPKSLKYIFITFPKDSYIFVDYSVTKYFNTNLKEITIIEEMNYMELDIKVLQLVKYGDFQPGATLFWNYSHNVYRVEIK